MKINNKNKGLYVLLIVFIMYISWSLSLRLKSQSLDIKDMFIYFYSYNFLNEEFSMLKIIIGSINTIIIISIFADVMWIELEKNAPYIFTRTKNTKKWITNKMVQIFLSLLKVELIQFIFFFFIAF